MTASTLPGRTFTCQACGKPATCGPRGPVPRHCKACKPVDEQRLARKQERRNVETVLRHRIADLEAELEDVRTAEQRGRALLDRHDNDPRRTLVVAVRNVQAAAGGHGTATALLELAAIARLWALRLNASGSNLRA